MNNNKDLMQDLVEKWGEEAQMEMIMDKTLSLASSLQKFKMVNRHEDFSLYKTSYDDVCEKIADMQLMVEQSRFIFNTDIINEHYKNKVNYFKNSLNEY